MRFFLTVFLLAATTVSAQPRVTSPVGAPFLGGVPSGTPSAEPLSLTIVDAINRGLQHNLGLLTAEGDVDRAKGARWEALADLMPNLNGRVSQDRKSTRLNSSHIQKSRMPSSA